MSLNIYNGTELKPVAGVVSPEYVDSKFKEQIDSGFLQSKNLCNPYSNKILNATVANSLSANNNTRTLYIEIKPNTTYTLSRRKFGRRWSIGLTDSISMGSTVYGLVENDDTTNPSVTIENTNHKYLVMYFWVNVDTLSAEEILKSIQIEESVTASDFVPSSGKSNSELTEDVVTLSRFEYSEDLPYGISYYRIGNLVQLIMANQSRNIAKNSLIVSGLPQPYKELILKSYLTADGKLPTFQLKPNGELRTDDVGVSNVWCAASITYICK